MNIGNVILQNNIFLAPMAGVTDSAFRLICREMGAGLVYSEMISAKGIYYNNENTNKMLQNHVHERPSAVQLFGSDPRIMADMAKKITNNYQFDIIDINMGCPAPKIVKNGEGSALMKNPKLIGEIVYAVANAVEVDIPVTVKIRKGFDSNSINAVEVAKIIEENGGQAVAVHGRTREQQYSGNADWDIIGEVKNAVKIPVIGNGDIISPEKALQMFNETKCDAVMIGRAAEGDPWIFRRILHYLDTNEILSCPSDNEKIEVALRHAEMTVNEKGEFTGIMEMRKHLCWYLKGVPGAAELRIKINTSKSLGDIRDILLNAVSK